MEKEECKNCIMNDKNKKQFIEVYEELKKRPNGMQVFSHSLTCFALGISVAALIVKFIVN